MKKQKLNTIKKIIITTLMVVLGLGLNTNTAKADNCEQNYGGGETCVVTTNFRIRKYVRLEGDKTWRDEVLVDLDDDDENDKRIEFKIEVSVNVSDDDADVSGISFDDMKMKDKWPDELKFLEDESDDDLTEEWDDFEPGETKTFYLTGKIESDERDRDDEFEKCVVNKASLYYEDDLQGSDEAVVCYRKTDDVLGITTSELPRTGAMPIEAIAGSLMLSLGVYLKSKKA